MKAKLLVLFISLIVLVAAVPAYQTATRFRSLIIQDFVTVGGATTLNGALTVGGATTLTGAVNQAGLQTLTGGLSVAPNVVIAAPTAIATATPAAYINNAGAHNSLVIAKNATPNFTVGNAGAVTGQVLQYVTSGQRQFCATNTITDTASYTSSTTAVATPVFTWCSMNAVTSDAGTCAARHATGTIVVEVRSSAVIPISNTVGAAVTWCVVGTP